VGEFQEKYDMISRGPDPPPTVLAPILNALAVLMISRGPEPPTTVLAPSLIGASVKNRLFGIS
jgi:hypothetical protein